MPARPGGQGFKGFVTAIEGGLTCYPITAFLAPPGTQATAENVKTMGWGYDTAGIPVVAALADDIDADGLPEIFLARKDGFVNVFRVTDGKALGLLNAGEPILGMAMLKDGQGRPRLAVGTKFSVCLFDAALKPAGRQAIAAVAFAGPGGKAQDRAYVVDAAGHVTVLALRP